MLQSRPRGVKVIAALMVALGATEMTTGVTRDYLSLPEASGGPVTAAGLLAGAGYAAAGLLLLAMRRWAAALAVLLLVATIAGRMGMVAFGIFPLTSPGQVVSIVAGTTVVALFALYIGWRWPEFR